MRLHRLNGRAAIERFSTWDAAVDNPEMDVRVQPLTCHKRDAGPRPLLLHTTPAAASERAHMSAHLFLHQSKSYRQSHGDWESLSDSVRESYMTRCLYRIPRQLGS